MVAVSSSLKTIFKKTERGIVLIHQYKNNGYNIVLDVYSGAVHVVDELCYDVIACLNEENEAHTPETLQEGKTFEGLKNALQDTYSEEELKDALDDVTELAKNGQLFVKDEYECLIEDVKKRKTVVKALCLHIAHDCNLACKYCFAEEGEYHGRRALMDFETGKKALDFLIVNKEMDNVVLSLDGRKEVNDRMRPFRNGKGSYDLIVPKFQKLADSRNQERYYVRGTFTRDNLDFSNDVLHFADLGFKQMSIEPVVGPETDPYAIREEDLPVIMEEYDKLAKIMIEREKEGKGFNFFHFMIDLEGGPCVAKRLSGCGSGTEYLAVTPWGDLYPCHQFVGQEEFLMGNVDEGVKRPEIADDFRSCNVYSKEKCKNCFAKFYCSGGCMANAYNFHGTIHDTYEIGCEMQRKRVECAIMMKAALADQ